MSEINAIEFQIHCDWSDATQRHAASEALRWWGTYLDSFGDDHVEEVVTITVPKTGWVKHPQLGNCVWVQETGVSFGFTEYMFKDDGSGRYEAYAGYVSSESLGFEDITFGCEA